MKNILRNINVRLHDWFRVLKHKVKPSPNHVVLEIHNSELKIGD